MTPAPTVYAAKREHPRIEFVRQGARDYQVLLDRELVGTVWKTHRSGWYCNAGHCGWTNRTRGAATALLLELTGHQDVGAEIRRRRRGGRT